MRATDPDYIPPVTKDDIVSAINEALALLEHEHITLAEKILLDLLEELGE